MRHHILALTALLAGLTSHVAAQGVKVVSPAAGATLSATGGVTIQVADSGAAPALSLLKSGQVVLYVGGNTAADSKELATVGTIAYPQLSATLQIGPGLAGPAANGFYFKIVSNMNDGGTVINYSNRFSLSGMVGTTEAKYVQAAAAAGSAVPAGSVQQGQAAAGGAAGGAVGDASLPYNEQVGLTKYAPMQSIPPTKITKQGNPTPLYPTSAYTVATTWLPRASIVTTVTEKQTFSVESIENTAAPQAQPTDNMAKFLARWKD